MTNEFVLKPSMFVIQSPPGDTLLEALEARGMTQAELALRTGRPMKTINEIIKGKAAITPDTALQLEQVLGISAGFWINREQQYRESLARQEARQRLEEQQGWLEQIPVQALIELGWMEAHENRLDLLDAVLKFFGIASPDQWEEIWIHAYKGLKTSKAFQQDPGSTIAWIRKGELCAQKLECNPFNSRVLRDSFQIFKNLTFQPTRSFYQHLQDLCCQTGIAFCVVDELPGNHLLGLVRWLNPDKAFIQLSSKFQTDASFWWAFFHALGHLLLHGKREVFIEEEGEAKNKKELQADQFAAETLASKADVKDFFHRYPRIDPETLQKFVRTTEVAPGVLIGRLQKTRHLEAGQFDEFKRHLDWSEIRPPESQNEAGLDVFEDEMPAELPLEEKGTTSSVPLSAEELFWPGLSDAARQVLMDQGLTGEAGKIDERLFSEWVGQKFHEISNFYREGKFEDVFSELQVLMTVFQQNAWRSAAINLMVQMTTFLKQLLEDALHQQEDALQDAQLLSQVGEMIRQINQHNIKSSENRANYSRAAMRTERTLQTQLFGESVQVSKDD